MQSHSLGMTDLFAYQGTTMPFATQYDRQHFMDEACKRV